MSPTYVNQRRLSDDIKTIPKVIKVPSAKEAEAGEDLVFDKAEQAEQTENAKRELAKGIETLETSLKEATEEDKARIKRDIELARERMKALEQPEAESDSEDATDQDPSGARGKPRP